MRQILSASIALAGALLVAAGASAQAAEIRCPAPGTAYTYKGGDGTSAHVASGQDGNVCLVRATADGKTETVGFYSGLLGSVDEAGDSYARAVDLKSLWPLKVDNRTQQTVNAIGRDGKPYSSDVTLPVATYEKITVPAGTFDVFRVEESKSGESEKRTHWWATSLGTSVKKSFPDWTDRTKLKVYELVDVTPAKP